MKREKHIIAKVAQLASIEFGLQGKSEDTGDVLFIQPRHFDNNGIPVGKIDSFLDKPDNAAKYLLQDGDILFAGKGVRNFATCYRIQQYGPAIASSSFYVIRPDQKQVYPEYLAVILNQPATNNYFQQVSTGMTVQSIRKSNLEDFELPLPDMATQQKVVAVTGLHLQRKKCIDQLAENYERMYYSIIKVLTEK